MRRTAPHIRTAAGGASYRTKEDGSITAVLDGGEEVRGEACLNTTCTPRAYITPSSATCHSQVQGDVLIGADGIWSNVRASATPRGTTRHMLPRISSFSPRHTHSLSHIPYPPRRCAPR